MSKHASLQTRVINLKKNEDEVNLVTLIDHDHNLCTRLILAQDEQKVLRKTFNYESPRKWRWRFS